MLYLLVISLMAGNEPVKSHQMEMPSLQECMSNAQAFLEAAEKKPGIKQAIAGCVAEQKPGNDI